MRRYLERNGIYIFTQGKGAARTNEVGSREMPGPGMDAVHQRNVSRLCREPSPGRATPIA
jgi:hypothetical protein